MNLPGMVTAFLLPVGVLLVAWGGLAPDQSRRAASVGLLAAAVSVVAYMAAGFAFQFGGIWHVVHTDAFRALDQVWSLPDSTGKAWNVAGLAGFFLSDAYKPDALALFVHQLPLVIAAALIPMLALSGRANNLIVTFVGLVVALAIFPLLGHWTWSNGWLAALGENMRLGHGYVDAAGAGPVYVAGGMLALIGLMLFARRDLAEDVTHPPEARLPEAHLPLLAVTGGLLFSVGWSAWIATNPLRPPGATLNVPLAMINGLLAASAATLVAQFYSWAAVSQTDPLLAARGWLAGWVVMSAAAPFCETWSALMLGALAGLVVPLTMYLMDRLLRLDDSTAAVSVYGVPGLLGILALGLVADGRWGAGWNGVGIKEYLAVTGQGVTGLMAAPDFVADAGQLTAQLAGAGAILAFALAAGGVTIAFARVAVKAWYRAGQRQRVKDEG